MENMNREPNKRQDTHADARPATDGEDVRQAVEEGGREE